MANTRAVIGRRILAAVFIFAGTMHFVIPANYVVIVPGFLPRPDMLVTLSGIAEVWGGIGLLVPKWQRVAGWGLIALLLAVFPANVQMLLNSRETDGGGLFELALWGRLPLQPLLIWLVWWCAIRPSRGIRDEA